MEAKKSNLYEYDRILKYLFIYVFKNMFYRILSTVKLVSNIMVFLYFK